MKFEWKKRNNWTTFNNDLFRFDFPSYVCIDEKNSIVYEYFPSIKNLCENNSKDVEIHYGKDKIDYHDTVIGYYRFNEDPDYEDEDFCMYSLEITSDGLGKDGRFHVYEDGYFDTKQELIDFLSTWIKKHIVNDEFRY